MIHPSSSKEDEDLLLVDLMTIIKDGDGTTTRKRLPMEVCQRQPMELKESVIGKQTTRTGLQAPKAAYKQCIRSLGECTQRCHKGDGQIFDTRQRKGVKSKVMALIPWEWGRMVWMWILNLIRSWLKIYILTKTRTIMRLHHTLMGCITLHTIELWTWFIYKHHMYNMYTHHHINIPITTKNPLKDLHSLMNWILGAYMQI